MKLLVANRSEIACRIFQACHELGLSTVAIVAPGDEEARHVTMADEWIRVKSYLDIDSIIEAAQKTGATLIHPGYGFLSERPQFVDACEKAGLTFIGPTAETMRMMGGKIEAKKIAIQAGVPTLPWANFSELSSTEEAMKIADQMGYPILLKAAAGGGGKGMRRVDHSQDLIAAAESAQQEALSAFGDGTLFIEKLVVRPRHIEVQIFGDGRGGGVHLFERECSLQRRHQKVWEEAPAPNLSEATRKVLYEASLNLVKTVRYRGAGTLEFLLEVDSNGQEKVYFLEMNTRLQVEHPVTELITGVDLVHAQIELALQPKTYQCLVPAEPRGHAIEVRLYAEDPAQGFLPTPGKIQKIKFPMGPGIRVDSGIEEGQTIGTLFDSMCAKLIVQAPTRQKAIARMRYALDHTVILGHDGFHTNQHYLRTLCDDSQVKAGLVYTHYLEERYSDYTYDLDAQDLEVIQILKNHPELLRQSHLTSELSSTEAGIATSTSDLWKKVQL